MSDRTLPSGYKGEAQVDGAEVTHGGRALRSAAAHMQLCLEQ